MWPSIIAALSVTSTGAVLAWRQLRYRVVAVAASVVVAGVGAAAVLLPGTAAFEIEPAYVAINEDDPLTAKRLQEAKQLVEGEFHLISQALGRPVLATYSDRSCVKTRDDVTSEAVVTCRYVERRVYGVPDSFPEVLLTIGGRLHAAGIDKWNDVAVDMYEAYTSQRKSAATGPEGVFLVSDLTTTLLESTRRDVPTQLEVGFVERGTVYDPARP